ncbi:hypothetical protein FSP39_012206 [Pinctada imbricata]|uniref:Integrase catalytic domain-containing protein n=1 Tax=Pinctada imbricata TaxID=66713 RepID=A0AA88YS81_PINIB|nr:hypothetical protein FSP39_012206 [Pinctada imbricata]
MDGKNDEYSLQKPAKRRQRKIKVIVKGKFDQYDADLADLSYFSKKNKGYKYLLIVIDVFSRFLWVEPLKTKRGVEMVKSLKHIFEKGRPPQKIRTDSGSEFTNKEVSQLFKSLNIYHHIARNDAKANYAERVILTIKQRLWRYFIKNRTHRYIDVIQAVVNGYNATPHRSLKNIAPKDVNQSNEPDIWAALYLKPTKETSVIKIDKKQIRLYKKKFEYKIGDMVRVSYKKLPFSKGYNQNWSSEIFKIKDRFLMQAVPMYKLVDFHEDAIKGNFHQFELARVQKSEQALWFIEKKIRKRRGNGQTEWLVKFDGWPAKYNQWITEDSIKDRPSS